jgi:hypothetical protein
MLRKAKTNKFAIKDVRDWFLKNEATFVKRRKIAIERYLSFFWSVSIVRRISAQLKILQNIMNHLENDIRLLYTD